MCSFMLVYFLYPETKGVPLEDMDRVFGEEPINTKLETSTSPEHEHAPFMPNLRINVDSYPPKPAPSVTRSAPGWLGRFFQREGHPGSPYHPIGEEEELAPLHVLGEDGPEVDGNRTRDVHHERD
ncbi:hypothetical protein H0H92_010910 [Tricholoma furcatifolium]|nr:hypothetical protein H0H92_010910 [Tricholoma furcatifolium]